VAGVIAGLMGLAFGLPATRFAGPYLALATFAIPLAFIGLLKNFGHFTGGTVGKTMPLFHSEFGCTRTLALALRVSWVVAFAMLVLAALIVRGRFGRALRATRDSEIAATSSGLSTAQVKTSAFGISAAFCGVAGSLFTMGNAYVNPDTFPIDLSILLLVGVVVGGAVARWDGLRRALRRVHPPGPAGRPVDRPPIERVTGLHVNTHAAGSSLVIYGAILLAILFVAPMGAAGLFRRLRSLTG
jgi:ABC-type branched-chain amino acid transport system, permease component